MFSKHLNIFVVDDDDADFHVLDREFKDKEVNAKLWHCKNSAAFITLLDQEDKIQKPTLGHKGTPQKFKMGIRPDVILLDINMPGVDGFTLGHYLSSKEALKNIPILFLTGRDSLEDVQKGLESGGRFYFVKPVDCKKLCEKIAGLASF